MKKELPADNEERVSSGASSLLETEVMRQAIFKNAEELKLEPAGTVLPGLETQKIRLNEEKTILVVDDESSILKFMEGSLIGAGFGNIKTASNGRNALEALGLIPQVSGKTVESDVELVVLDVILPDTNGFEICRQIRRSNCDIPVILISGHDIEEIQNKLIECGADDFLEKPFSRAELFTRVKLLMNRKRKRQYDAGLAEPTILKFNMNHNIPFIGDNINGYIILDPLGWGKNSLVYKVINTDTRKIFSLKMLSRSSIENKDTVERFKNEVEIMSKMKHPNIVEFIDSGCHNGCPYLVMEHVDGVDLEEYLVTRGKISLSSFSHIAYDIASAISELHRNKICHRDIKLKNILYDMKSGEAKLSDFGIAKRPESLGTTQEGFIVGTPIYLAPEIFMGELCTIQSDIYSYGATLYHLITGSPPFVAENSIELFRKHKLKKPPPINSIRPGLPEEWNMLIVKKCLAKDPVDRPASMHDVQMEIERIFAGLKQGRTGKEKLIKLAGKLWK
ncbi:MAG: protein kinase [Victivallales bacterium]